MSNPFGIPEHEYLKTQLHGSFLLFCQTFFPIVTGRPFSISNPIGRESHFVSIARELTRCKDLKDDSMSLIINVPPGSGKSTLCGLWCAWCLSQYPDSQFLYISYSHELAAKHTFFIKRIIECTHYRNLFGVSVRHDSKAKDSFMTEQGGRVSAYGSSSGITGQDGGLPNLDRFSGSVIMDDLHKPLEAHSDTIRQGVIQNYKETILQRARSPRVPYIYIGQRVHEDDIAAHMLSEESERKYRKVVLKAIDDAGNALYPEVNPLEQLLEKKAKNNYTFHSQYQQEPVPSSGALYRREDFVLLDEEPEALVSFVCCDTAETAKNYNDASVFSFFGVYKLSDGETLALHCIDSVELRVEPKHLEAEFKSFWGDCMLYKVKPKMAAIEKKSTGVTLLSILEDTRGLELREVKRTAASGSKTARFLEMQPIVASKLISFNRYAKHTERCIAHMIKITANDSHRHDDICDTFYDACKIALIDQTLYTGESDGRNRRVAQLMAKDFNKKRLAIAGAR